MQLCNAAASDMAPLHYPPGIVPGPYLPSVKQELRYLSGKRRLDMLKIRCSRASRSRKLQYLDCRPRLNTARRRGSR
jgi:hypothetical protein